MCLPSDHRRGGGGILRGAKENPRSLPDIVHILDVVDNLDVVDRTDLYGTEAHVELYGIVCGVRTTVRTDRQVLSVGDVTDASGSKR